MISIKSTNKEYHCKSYIKDGNKNVIVNPKPPFCFTMSQFHITILPSVDYTR
jgi:hypothetical protein